MGMEVQDIRCGSVVEVTPAKWAAEATPPTPFRTRVVAKTTDFLVGVKSKGLGWGQDTLAEEVRIACEIWEVPEETPVIVVPLQSNTITLVEEPPHDTDA